MLVWTFYGWMEARGVKPGELDWFAERIGPRRGQILKKVGEVTKDPELSGLVAHKE